jgi:hypothetical protein
MRLIALLLPQNAAHGLFFIHLGHLLLLSEPAAERLSLSLHDDFIHETVFPGHLADKK